MSTPRRALVAAACNFPRVVQLSRSRLSLRAAPALAAALLLHLAAALALLSHKAPPTPDPGVAMEVILAPLPHARASASPPQSSPPMHAPARASQPTALKPSPAPAARDWTVKPGPSEKEEAIRGALREQLGCDRARFLALTAKEREACADRWAADMDKAPTYAVVSPKLQKQFDGVFECPKDDVWCEYRIGKAPYPGLLQLGRKKKRSEWD